jgi:hypothetical protein
MCVSIKGFCKNSMPIWRFSRRPENVVAAVDHVFFTTFRSKFEMMPIMKIVSYEKMQNFYIVILKCLSEIWTTRQKF